MFAFFLSDLHQTCLTFDREFVLKETLTVKYIYIREEIHKNEKQWQAVHERLYGSHSVSWIVHLDLKSHIIKSTSEPYYREMSSWKWQRTWTNNNNNNNRCWWTAGPDSTLTVSDEQWQMSNTETIKKKETWNCSRETRSFHVSEQGAGRESHPASLCDSSTQQHTAIHSNTQGQCVCHPLCVSITAWWWRQTEKETHSGCGCCINIHRFWNVSWTSVCTLCPDESLISPDKQ